MASRDPSDHDVVDPLADDPLAFLYEPGDEDEDNPPPEHPGYGSLMGLKVGARKTGKVMAIVLEEHEAQRAAEVMEINAGQLMTNPDRSTRQIGFQSLGLDAGEEEAEEDDLAESLNWEAEEDGAADWQPENPLAGTGIVDDEDDAEWQPENPLAGTGIVQDDEDDWQAENPLAGTEFAGQDDWATAQEPPAETAAPDTGLSEFEDDWNVSSPPAEQFADAAAPADDVTADAEWELPVAATPEPEEPPAEAVAAFETPVEADPPATEAPQAVEEELLPEPAATLNPVSEPAPEDPQEAENPAANATIDWQALLVKKTGKKQVELPPIDWAEFAAEDAPAGDVPFEPGAPPADGWADEPADASPALLPEPEWQAYAGEEAEEAAAADAFEPELTDASPPPTDDRAGPYDTEWSAFAAPPPAEPAAPEPEPEPETEYTYEPEFTAEYQPDPEYPPAPEPPPVLEQIEIVRFPAPQPVETPHHSLRAKVMKAQQAKTPPASRLKPLFQWLAARFRQFVLPQLKRLAVWAGAKWSEIASRSRRG